jgi:hypothetical protein
LDRRKVTIISKEEQEMHMAEELSNLTVSERFQTITYLRECFYGPEATTGRLQRVYRVLKQK